MDSLTPTQVDELEREAHARATDPITSHLAASTVDLTRRQIQVLEVFRADDGRDDRHFIENRRDGGFTDEEMVRAVQTSQSIEGQKMPSPSGLRTARKALVDAGLLERAALLGQGPALRKTVLGNWAYVWVLTEAGRAFQVPQ